MPIIIIILIMLVSYVVGYAKGRIDGNKRFLLRKEGE